MTTSEREALVKRLRERARIRRQIPTRKSVQNNEPDRIADLLDEAADALSPDSVEVPTSPGWYWLSDKDDVRIVEVFRRPGHDYLVIDTDESVFGKRDFYPVAKMNGAIWAGPIDKPCAMLAAAQPDESVGDTVDYKERWLDLIMQVGNKYPGESRHDTAKRYIIAHENNHDSRPRDASLPKTEKGE